MDELGCERTRREGEKNRKVAPGLPSNEEEGRQGHRVRKKKKKRGGGEGAARLKGGGVHLDPPITKRKEKQVFSHWARGRKLRKAKRRETGALN